ncbi:hypothetical protein [Heyndrickxia ginsengihumi]|nr:hypothetical protein [Heyndrickxia ginsengihumi]
MQKLIEAKNETPQAGNAEEAQLPPAESEHPGAEMISSFFKKAQYF